jgi:hypothetical protein
MRIFPSLGLTLALAAGAVPGESLFSGQATAQIAGICWLYNQNYSARAGGPGAPSVESVITIKNPGTKAVPVMVEWIDTFGATVGTSGPVPIPPQGTREFTTEPAPALAFPFGLDVPAVTGAGGPLPAFEGGARIYRTDTSCKTTNKLGVNGQVVIDIYGPLPEYIHTKIDRPRGMTGD